MAKPQKRSGSYSVRVSLTDPDTGQRTQKRVTAATKRELDAAVADLKARWNSGNYFEPSTDSVSDYFEHWLKSIELTVKPGTVNRYRQNVTLYVVPVIGTVPLAKVTPLAIQRLVNDLVSSGRSPASARLCFAVMRRAFGQAVKWKLIAWNPCTGVDVPRGASPEMQTWNLEDANRFLSAVADMPLAAFWQLALVTGMRRGELLALRWQDLDLDRGTLAVRRTMAEDMQRKWTYGEPKSAAGRRAITVPAPMVASLKAHRARQNERRLALGEGWNDAGLVFDRGDGTPYNPVRISNSFRALNARLGLPRIRFHDLRHTAATLMMADGVHPKIVQERLGHSKVSMTLDRYSHVTESMQRDAADRLASRLGLTA